MPDLFRRDWLVRVDEFQFAGLDVAFDVVKTVKRQPNTCTLSVWGMSQDQRDQVVGLSVKKKQRGRIRVEIEAGYEGSRSLIFRGDLRTAEVVRSGPEVELKIEGDDGGRSILQSRINRSYPAGTPVVVAIRDCAAALGVGTGNLEALAAAARTRGGAIFSSGTVLSGNASEELTGILRSCGLTWSVQNGVLSVLRAGQALNTSAVRLAPHTGLVGEIAPNPDGTIGARALLIPDLIPGGRVLLQARTVQTMATILAVKYHGDTHGQDWYADLILKPYVAA